MFKGGETLKDLKGVEKKKKKKVKPPPSDAVADGEEGAREEEPAAGQPGKPAKPVDPSAVNVMSGKKYEEEFDLETKRALEGKVKNTPWGSSFRAPPEILHGYAQKVTGKNAEERLDLRSARKSDKFCK